MNLLFWCTRHDKPYIPYLKEFFRGHNVYLREDYPMTMYEVAGFAKEKKVDAVITTNEIVLQKLLESNRVPSIDQYAGSIIENRGLEYLILNPIAHLLTVTYGKHLYARYISKILRPNDWITQTPFTWEVATPSTIESLFASFNRADFIAVDSETYEVLLAIECVGYCAIWFDRNSKTYKTHTVVIPLEDSWSLSWIRKFNNIPAPKITQNGKYDNAYFLRFNCPLRAWYWDTINLFHCWYSEMPKDLASVSAYTIRKFQYWKNESAAAQNKEEFYRYNAKDCYGTALAFIGLLRDIPQWAIVNYLKEFPLVYPCIVAETTGMRVDKNIFAQTKQLLSGEVENRLRSLRSLVGSSTYNPSSPPQTVRLIAALGSRDIKSSDKVSIDKVINRHPLNRRIFSSIRKFRQDRKRLSSYTKDSIFLPKIEVGKLDGTVSRSESTNIVLYSINPHGTDTSRLASKEHHFWCGLQIQNIPREAKEAVSIKSMFVPPIGFKLGEADREQAETRDTAYISGDTKLIAAVESGKDFHSMNTSLFFGMPYEKVVDVQTEKVIDKDRRELTKRVSHGMDNNLTSPTKLIDTLGIENIVAARKLVNLPGHYSLEKVAQYLIDKYIEAYPISKKEFPAWVKHTVDSKKMITGSTGWTRYCFGNTENKRVRNSYVAHLPQHLNAQELNKAWMRVFYEVWLPNYEDFLLHAQIHDSIIFSYRNGRLDLAKQVKICMENPLEVTDIFGIKRIMKIPVALKAEGNSWSTLQDIQ